MQQDDGLIAALMWTAGEEVLEDVSALSDRLYQLREIAAGVGQPRDYWAVEHDGQRCLLWDLDNHEVQLVRLEGTTIELTFFGVLAGGKVVEKWTDGLHELVELHHPALDGPIALLLDAPTSASAHDGRDYLRAIVSRGVSN